MPTKIIAVMIDAAALYIALFIVAEIVEMGDLMPSIHLTHLYIANANKFVFSAVPFQTKF